MSWPRREPSGAALSAPLPAGAAFNKKVFVKNTAEDYYERSVIFCAGDFYMKGESVVTPATVSGIAQALPLLSPEPSNSPPQEEKRPAAANATAALTRDNRQPPVDTVTLSSQSRQTATDVKKEAAKKEETKAVSNSGKPGRSAAKVEFVYDLKGELITRYMDTAERLIYQVPSELMLHMKEAGITSDPAVDTKA